MQGGFEQNNVAASGPSALIVSRAAEAIAARRDAGDLVRMYERVSGRSGCRAERTGAFARARLDPTFAAALPIPCGATAAVQFKRIDEHFFSEDE